MKKRIREAGEQRLLHGIGLTVSVQTIICYKDRRFCNKAASVIINLPVAMGPVFAPQEVCMKIERNRVVSIQYTLKDDAGTVIDSSEGRDPLRYLHGNNNLIPGLEKALEGLEAGKQLLVKVPPEEGYGPRAAEMVQEVPKNLFENEELEVGMQFQVQGEGGIHILTVAEIRDEVVVVDGNHPLAGANLNFDVTIVSVREASAEEIAHGHVH